MGDRGPALLLGPGAAQPVRVASDRPAEQGGSPVKSPWVTPHGKAKLDQLPTSNRQLAALPEAACVPPWAAPVSQGYFWLVILASRLCYVL